MKHRHKVNMDFVYVPSHKTNIGRTIARARKELAEAQQKQAAADQEATAKVRPMQKRRAS